MSTTSIGAGVGIALVLAVAIADQAMASAANDESESAVLSRPMLEEVIVSAQRREEDLQSVPISISALTARDLENSGIAGTLDLQMVIPGLTNTITMSSPTPFIRGVGSSDIAPSNEGAVATYVDGIYMAATPAGLFAFNNLERVEVLKGPQGTLFGRNATGGLIQVITKDPTEETTGNVSVGYGNFDTVSSSAYFSAGLASHLAGDLALVYSDQGEGWGENLFTGQEVYKTDDVGLRSKVRFDNGDTTITLAGLYFRHKSDVGGAWRVYPGATLLNGDTLNKVGFYNINDNLIHSGYTENVVPSLTITRNVGFASLVSLTSYQRTTANIVVGTDAVPIVVSKGNVTQSVTAVTQELQLVSPLDSPVKWIVGAFYMHRNGDYDPIEITSRFADIKIYGEQTTSSVASFGQLTVPITKTNNITAGVRYNMDSQRANTLAHVNGFQVGNTSYANEDFDSLSFRLSADQRIGEDLLLYASYNRGFKGGLFNLANYPISNGRALPEKLDSYEVGFKSDLFDRRLRLNGSAYYYNYQDLQQVFVQGPSVVTLNARSAHLKGLELEGQMALADGLQVHAGLSWMPQAQYITFTGAPITTPVAGGGNTTVVGSVAGNRMPRSSRIQTNLGIDYTVLTRVGRLAFNLTQNYLSRFYWVPDNRISQAPYQLFNAQAKLTFARGLAVALWGKNIGAKEYQVFGTSTDNGDTGIPGAPRTYGATVSYTF